MPLDDGPRQLLKRFDRRALRAYEQTQVLSLDTDVNAVVLGTPNRRRGVDTEPRDDIPDETTGELLLSLDAHPPLLL